MTVHILGVRNRKSCVMLAVIYKKEGVCVKYPDLFDICHTLNVIVIHSWFKWFSQNVSWISPPWAVFRVWRQIQIEREVFLFLFKAEDCSISFLFCNKLQLFHNLKFSSNIHLQHRRGTNRTLTVFLNVLSNLRFPEILVIWKLN